MFKTNRILNLTLACAVAFPAVLTIASATPTFGQEDKASVEPKPLTGKVYQVSKAKLRTWEEMERDEATQGPVVSRSIIPYRPTMDPASYMAAKRAAAMERHLSLTNPLSSEPESPLGAPVLKGTKFNGIDQSLAGGLAPPDTHGAIGLTQFTEVTNSHIQVFGRGGYSQKSVHLSSFFGYTAETLFDPRVVYDNTYRRWVVTAVAFPESSTTQQFFISVSQNSSATSSFYMYRFDVDSLDNGDFFDFPQLGMDQDGIIITANIFTSGGSYEGADVISMAKARLYNGRGLSIKRLRSVILASMTPPIVLDQDARAFIVAVPTSGNAIKLFTLRDSSRPFGAALYGPQDVSVTAYSPPPNAPQTSACSGSSNLLDTGDSRFVNASTQIGTALYNAHTINVSGFARPRYYQINTATATVTRSSTFSKSSTSYDFNASIAANNAGDVYVTWSATDPTNGTNAQIRFSGRRATDSSTIPSGTALLTSPTCLTGNFDPNFGMQRWGDYSAVTVDPTNPLLAWIVNEKINSSSQWGSHIARIGF